jgi:Arc/MetJ-type ribon-helix-helix transcriptional regulator
MEVHFTEDQKAFIREALETGRLQREEDAVREAMMLWEERERRRMEILAAVDKAEASLARGEGRRVKSRDGSIQLASDVEKRGAARLSSHQDAG